MLLKLFCAILSGFGGCTACPRPTSDINVNISVFTLDLRWDSIVKGRKDIP